MAESWLGGVRKSANIDPKATLAEGSSMRRPLRSILMATFWTLPLGYSGPLDDAGAADDHGYATVYARERLLADQGDAEAQYRLSYLYLLGQGLTQDRSEAISWLRRAGYQGFALAGLALCLDYANGLGGVEQNYFEAVEWCRLAANKGIPAGSTDLASCTPVAKAFCRTTFSRTCG